MSDHDDFEGLAAGYALHALEPEDEQRLAVHLMTCRSCARLVADTAALGAAFAELIAEAAEPPPAELRDRILAAAAAEPRELTSSPQQPRAFGSHPDDRPPVTVTVAPQRRPVARVRRMQLRGKIAVGVLAAAVGIGIAIPVTWAVSDSGRPSVTNSALAQWLLEPNAREVTLRSSSGSAVAKAVMTDKGVFLLADGLPVNDRSRSIYVLWAGNGNGARAAIATFDVRGGSAVQLTATRLPMKSSDISNVAISYEPGRKAPSNPSDVVLSGIAA